MSPREALSLTHSILGKPSVLELVRKVRDDVVQLLCERGFVHRSSALIDRLAAGQGHQLSARVDLEDPATGHALSLYTVLAVSVDLPQKLRTRMWLEVRSDDDVRYASPDLRDSEGCLLAGLVGCAPQVDTQLSEADAEAALESAILGTPAQYNWDNVGRVRLSDRVAASLGPGN